MSNPLHIEDLLQGDIDKPCVGWELFIGSLGAMFAASIVASTGTAFQVIVMGAVCCLTLHIYEVHQSIIVSAVAATFGLLFLRSAFQFVFWAVALATWGLALWSVYTYYTAGSVAEASVTLKGHAQFVGEQTRSVSAMATDLAGLLHSAIPSFN
eukprot:Hpha_TRINITY_DN15358_c1_g2::TRINITY_DN15358_c1_g2_i1::g.87450::m.87450